MALDRAKNIRSSADPNVSSISLFSLSILDVLALANYQNCLGFACAEAIYLCGFRSKKGRTDNMLSVRLLIIMA